MSAYDEGLKIRKEVLGRDGRACTRVGHRFQPEPSVSDTGTTRLMWARAYTKPKRTLCRAHLCYGDDRHRRTLQPQSTAVQVACKRTAS
jgi:hypothetical protein